MSAKFWSDGNNRRQRPQRRDGRPRYNGHRLDEAEAAMAAELQARLEFNQIAKQRYGGGLVYIRR